MWRMSMNKDNISTLTGKGAGVYGRRVTSASNTGTWAMTDGTTAYYLYCIFEFWIPSYSCHFLTRWWGANRNSNRVRRRTLWGRPHVELVIDFVWLWEIYFTTIRHAFWRCKVGKAPGPGWVESNRYVDCFISSLHCWDNSVLVWYFWRIYADSYVPRLESIDSLVFIGLCIGLLLFLVSNDRLVWQW